MALIYRLLIVVGLLSFVACGQCRDKLAADGHHMPCNNACVVKDVNKKDRHDQAQCYCSTSCPCWSAPPKEEEPKK